MSTARNVFVELNRRSTALSRRRVEPPARLGEFLSTFFDKQQEVLAAQERWLAALCPRRAGKSTLIPGKLFAGMEAWRRRVGPCIGLYIHPDGRPRAVETLWKPMVALNEAYNLGWDTNATTATFSKPDGTEIRFRGADDAREAQKFRGDTRPIALAVVDEAQNFPDATLCTLIDDSLGPALADVEGQMLLAGTPGQVCAGRWYDITRNDTPESAKERLHRWRVITWSNLDNPHRRVNIAKEIAGRLEKLVGMAVPAIVDILLGPGGAERGAVLSADDASTLREFFGRWVKDLKGRYYAFNESLNLYDGKLPPGHVWYYVLGGDLGTDDSYAHHVWAVANTCDTIHEVESFAQGGLHAGEWRERYAAAQKRWRPVASVLDEGGLGKGVAEEWRATYHMDVEAAEKLHKAAAAATLNGELREGRVKVLASPAAERPEVPAGATAAEWATLTKDPNPTPGKPVMENPGQPNHASDSALYSFRKALSLAGRDTKPVESMLWDDKRRAEEERIKRARERVLAERDALDELGAGEDIW